MTAPIKIFAIAALVFTSFGNIFWAHKAREWREIAIDEDRVIKIQDNAVNRAIDAMNQYQQIVMKLTADQDVCVSMLPIEQRRSFVGK